MLEKRSIQKKIENQIVSLHNAGKSISELTKSYELKESTVYYRLKVSINLFFKKS